MTLTQAIIKRQVVTHQAMFQMFTKEAITAEDEKST